MSAVTASLCSTLLFFSLFVFVSTDPETITAEPGQNVTLPCQAPNNNITVVKWSRADQCVLLYRDEQSDPEHQHPSFKNRVDLQDRQMKNGNVSLILKNVTTADNGTYECHVQKDGDSLKLISNINLSVVDLPGQTGGHTGKKSGHGGLIVGLIVVVFVVIAVVIVVVVNCRERK
ncbi:programmed cell death 1 ligand 1-like [Oreochromis aureus]|uniref:programmed cell death 1 ligand 1-like n=1 Tax=Oreochromis aureus TaxID=47969 RepID=UPI001954F1D1|nr:programmed cell death 1 ligand 1-like [Oreochromis aureus]